MDSEYTITEEWAKRITALLSETKMVYRRPSRSYALWKESPWGNREIFSFSFTSLSCGIVEIYWIHSLSREENWKEVLKITIVCDNNIRKYYTIKGDDICYEEQDLFVSQEAAQKECDKRPYSVRLINKFK